MVSCVPSFPFKKRRLRYNKSCTVSKMRAWWSYVTPRESQGPKQRASKFPLPVYTSEVSFAYKLQEINSNYSELQRKYIGRTIGCAIKLEGNGVTRPWESKSRLLHCRNLESVPHVQSLSLARCILTLSLILL